MRMLFPCTGKQFRKPSYAPSSADVRFRHPIRAQLANIGFPLDEVPLLTLRVAGEKLMGGQLRQAPMLHHVKTTTRRGEKSAHLVGLHYAHSFLHTGAREVLPLPCLE